MIQKLILSLMLLGTFGFASAQSKYEQKMERKANFYASEAAKEFGLNKKKEKMLAETKLAQMKANQSLNKKKREGEFKDDDEFKAKRREAMKPYMDKMLKITGVKRKELNTFNKETNSKMKDIQ